MKRSLGDGDLCPLFPEHGHMYSLTEEHPPLQYCPHQQHDGGTGTTAAPASRCFWPLYGLEDSVKAYMARLDKAIREAGLPDLSDLEVK